MPNIKSAKKRLKTSEEARQANQEVKSRVKKKRRSFIEAVASNDKAASEEIFKDYCSVLDKAAKHGVIKKNTAIRRKRRAAKKVQSLA